MTLDELGALVAGRRIARHKGSCFFTTHDPDEADAWRQRGADVRGDTPGGHFMAEVHLARVLDPPTEVDDEGAPVDNRAALVLDYFRERDGFEIPLHERAVAREAGRL